MTISRKSGPNESAAGEEDPGAGLDASDSAIRPDGVAPSAGGSGDKSGGPPPGSPTPEKAPKPSGKP